MGGAAGSAAPLLLTGETAAAVAEEAGEGGVLEGCAVMCVLKQGIAQLRFRLADCFAKMVG